MDNPSAYVMALQYRLGPYGLTLIRIRTKEELRRWLKMKRL
jgi:hypothetical protein